MRYLEDPSILAVIHELFLVCRHLGRALPSIGDVPTQGISKYAFYLASLKEGGPPKVVRSVVKGWGSEQHQIVISAAEDASQEPTCNEGTAVISDYGSPANPFLTVSVFIRGYRLNESFAFRMTEDGFEYVQSDEEAEKDILRLIGNWLQETGAKPPRKKFLGLF